MKHNNTGKIILVLSIPLALLVITVSCIGIFTPDFYSREAMNWQIQSIGQDVIDLFIIVPALLITAIFAYRKNSTTALLWSGTVLYILYVFTIYCFDVHFNKLFIIYCFTLGLSFYSLLWFLYSQIKEPVVKLINRTSVIKTTGIYFLILSLVFYFLWLSEIIPAAINNTTPISLTETGLFTNPIHIIDLSVFLPGIFITGLLILKRKPLGFLFAAIMLTFFILMDITIGYLAIMMNKAGLQSNLLVTVVMAFLALISFVILVWNIKNMKEDEAPLKFQLNVDIQ